MRLTSTYVCVLAAILGATAFLNQASAADAPKDKVLAIYFHRTERCPTCKKMGAYAEEAVKAKFADRIKKGTVAFHYVDYQQKKNAKLAKGYGVKEPSLIIARIKDKKVVRKKNLTEIWSKVGDKKTFFAYVQKHLGDMGK